MKNRKVLLKTLVATCSIVASVSLVNAQTKPVPKDSIREIEEIYVKGHSLKSKNTTSKVDVVTNDEIKNLVIEQPLRILEQVPGINVMGYGQGGVADQFSMRGFRGAGHEGEAGVEIDGVSLNEAEGHGDGYADLNILIPLNLKKISVYKGPSSALYGRFSQAGTISLETRKGGNYNDIRLSGGSYTTFDAQYAFGKTIKVGEKDDALKTNFAVQFFTTNGYLKNSKLLKGNVSGRIAYQISPKSEIAISILGHKSDWNATGFLPKEQYENKKLRNHPHPTAENDGGNKSFLSERIDFNHKISDNIKLLVFGYAVQQEFTRFAKFRFGPNDKQSERHNLRKVFAFGGSLNGNTKLADKDFNWIGGVEFYTEKTGKERWFSAYRKRGEQFQDKKYNIQSFSAYAQAEWDLHQLFRPSVGLRFDTFGGKYENNDDRTKPFKHNLKGTSHFSPKLGFRSTLVNHFDFRANVSNGFTLATGDYNEAKYNTRSLKPVQLWQYEAGFSYNNEKNFSFDISGFLINSSKEILERPQGSGLFVNAGKTRRMGIEADTKISPIESLTFRGSFTYTDTKIKEGDNEGKSLTQVPKTVLNLGGVYTSPIGLGADLNYRFVSDYYTTDDNAFKGGGYNLVNLKVFYNFDKLFSSKGNIFFAVNNLFNEYYAETIFGNRLFSASPTRNFTVGVNYSF